MRLLLQFTFSFLLCVSLAYGSERHKEDEIKLEFSKALHEEIKEKSNVLQLLEKGKSTQVPSFVTEQYKKYLDALKELEISTKEINSNLENLEEEKFNITQTYNIFTESYYQ